MAVLLDKTQVQRENQACGLWHGAFPPWGTWRGLFGLFGGERRCHACQGVFFPHGEELFCPSCLPALARREQGFCPGCGELAPWPILPTALCGQCLIRTKPWQTFLFHAAYEGLLRALLMRLKFRNTPQLALALGRLLGGHPAFAALEYDFIVPIPLHEKRLILRGYNQTLEIARHLCARPYGKKARIAPNLLQRRVYTTPQTGLSTPERKRNTRGVFRADSAVRGKHLLLLDDIMTTGATLESAALTLQEAGAASITAAVVARAPKGW